MHYSFLCGDVHALLCAGDVERCPGPTQTRLTSFEAKSMLGASGKSGPPQRQRPRPTE